MLIPFHKEGSKHRVNNLSKVTEVQVEGSQILPKGSTNEAQFHSNSPKTFLETQTLETHQRHSIKENYLIPGGFVWSPYSLCVFLSFSVFVSVSVSVCVCLRKNAFTCPLLSSREEAFYYHGLL